jgi:hypothetical protein
MSGGRIVVKFNHFQEIAAQMPNAVGKIVRKTARDIEADAEQSMEGPKSGQMYGAHQASAPGEAPAVDTGNLKCSIDTEMTSKTTAVVAVGAEYGAHLEYGTRKMAMRPYLRPAVERKARAFVDAMRALEGHLK